ncbi:MAG: hypothetical protein V1859_01245 [archaeon]
MIKIDSLNKQSEVNRELDSYLTGRVSNDEKKHNEKSLDFDETDSEFNEEKVPLLKKMFGGEKKVVVDNDNESDAVEQKPQVKEIEEIEEEVEEEIKEEKEEEFSDKDEKKSFFARIFSIFSDDDNTEEEELNEESFEEENEKEHEKDEEDSESDSMISDDVKKLIKLQHKWINKLDLATLEEFKNSEDFAYYKEVLGKYGLIKK